MQRRRLTDAMLLVRAAVLAAVLGQFLGPSLANRPAGAHPGHAYFEQPCCGRSHLRHHKETLTLGPPPFPFRPGKSFRRAYGYEREVKTAWPVPKSPLAYITNIISGRGPCHAILPGLRTPGLTSLCARGERTVEWNVEWLVGRPPARSTGWLVLHASKSSVERCSVRVSDLFRKVPRVSSRSFTPRGLCVQRKSTDIPGNSQI
ncbi:hypothetical protein KM043_016246 [Ampulex compressa]|nr:hypothetical protein KM043_016246 [Ampulex compressa]